MMHLAIEMNGASQEKLNSNGMPVTKKTGLFIEYIASNFL